MAGIRQHIIPKLLQKGFASRVDKDQVFTWVYRKNATPFQANINNINVEKYFYGKSGNLNADDEITDVEKYKLAPLINEIRDGICDFEKSKTEIGGLVAHFSIRTKLVREGFRDMSEQMLRGMGEITTDEKVLENLFLNPPKHLIEEQFDAVLSDSNNEELKNAFQIFKILGIPKNDVKNFITDLTFAEFENEETRNDNKDILTKLFSETFEKSVELIPDYIKEGHIKSLAKNTIPKPRVEKYKEMDWSVFETVSPLILGDVACISKNFNDNEFRPSCNLENVSQIYLPISATQLLVGTFNSEKVETDVKILNKAIAQCSYEQFICSELSEDKVELIQFIRTNSQLVNDDEIKNELDEIRNNFEKLHQKDS